MPKHKLHEKEMLQSNITGESGVTSFNSEEHLSEETPRRLEQIRARTVTIPADVRRFSHELRPDVLDQPGMV